MGVKRRLALQGGAGRVAGVKRRLALPEGGKEANGSEKEIGTA